MNKKIAIDKRDQLNREITKLETLVNLLDSNSKVIELDPHGLALLLDSILDGLKTL